MNAPLQPAPPFELGPWPMGIVNSLTPRALPQSALVDAVNVDLDQDGNATSRPTYTLIDDTSAYSSGFEHGGKTYAVAKNTGTLGILGDQGFTALASVPGDVEWAVHQGDPIFTHMNGTFAIEPNGTVSGGTVGGQAVAVSHGRVFVARGRRLLWTNAMTRFSMDSSRNFWIFGSPIIWMAALPGGIYVAEEHQVWFLKGTDVRTWRQEMVAGPSAPKSGAVVDSQYMQGPLAGQGMVAVWWTETGFAVGTSSGNVLYPQADRLRGLSLEPCRIVAKGSRLFVFELRG